MGADPESGAETGKAVGWEPVEQSGFAKLHAQAVAETERDAAGWLPGTYELCGPKVNGNPRGESVKQSCVAVRIAW